MAIRLKFKDSEFGVGDTVRVVQRIKEGDKERNQYFDGIVIAIKGKGSGKVFVVRKIGVQQIGIEKIFPVENPSIKEVKVLKRGTAGVRKAKLYYIRGKSRKEISRIYQKASLKENK
ncbi:MAG: 50S ribosomal protein L19 [Patescibacteria group bacterium]|nr:MAG: 50S ribosomal protein L19 [Patescibacteria group bacterium]